VQRTADRVASFLIAAASPLLARLATSLELGQLPQQADGAWRPSSPRFDPRFAANKQDLAVSRDGAVALMASSDRRVYLVRLADGKEASLPVRQGS
jgi:hypothetical protein